MKNKTALNWLVPFMGIFALVAAGVGLFWQNGGSPFSFTTLHGQTVQMYGQGIYSFDTYFKAPIFRGTDAVTIFLSIPLLVFASVLYRRGSLRGQIFLTGMLACFLYNSASVALGTAYNNLFLVYTIYFSTSLFAFILAYQSIDLQALAARMKPGLPHRGLAALLFVSGVALLFAWLTDIVSALLLGKVPDIASYTTEITYVLDLGIIVPLLFLSGILLLRRAPVSYLLAPILIIMLAVIGVIIASQTIAQSLAGITLSTGQFIGKAGTFMLLCLFAIGLMVRFFRNVTE
jgi:hypothetical protein